MISLLRKRLQNQTLSAIDLYAKTLNELEKSNLNAFVHINRDGAQQAADGQKRLQNGSVEIKSNTNLRRNDLFCV